METEGQSLMETEGQRVAEPSADYDSLLASDGFPARKSGERDKRKFHFLRNYCGITTVAMRQKWRLQYLDVMAGPGRCKNAETGAEFPGSPFVALDYGFNDFLFVEEDAEMANALEERIRQHPKKELIQIVRRDWTELARSGKLKFSEDTLVVAFIDPTGISQVPMNAMLQLTKNKR